MKRSQPNRNWDDIDIDQMTPCLLCGMEGRTERAHVLGRKYDAPHPVPLGWCARLSGWIDRRGM